MIISWSWIFFFLELVHPICLWEYDITDDHLYDHPVPEVVPKWKYLLKAFEIFIEKICSHSDYQLIGSAIFVFTYKTVMHANHQHNAMANAHKGVFACFLKHCIKDTIWCAVSYVECLVSWWGPQIFAVWRIVNDCNRWVINADWAVRCPFSWSPL